MSRIREYFLAIAGAVVVLVLALFGLAQWWERRKAVKRVGEAANELADEHEAVIADIAKRDTEAAHNAAVADLEAGVDAAKREVDDGSDDLVDFLTARGATRDPD